ncbi:uncharacterized protein LOC117643902 [Thrips palmi]|uniref:Uncharacterized protein LOC117643902 n=1 Tax=Thrips palmi TaxID=161013 RepID=A0A6P8YP00_THRPL|nr:uncharacterized protein LOC117643902 [Thrips palmi]
MGPVQLWALVALLVATRQVLSRTRIRIAPKFHGIWTCPAELNHFTTIFNYSVGMDANGLDVMNVDGRIDRKIMTVSKFDLLVHRCQAGMSNDNCEYFFNWSWKNGCCNLLAQKGVFYSPILDSISPPFICPMDKYFYTLRNSTMNIDEIGAIMSSMALENWVWKGQFQVWNEKRELVVCAYVIGDLRRYKVKN